MERHEWRLLFFTAFSLASSTMQPSAYCGVFGGWPNALASAFCWA